MVKTVEKRLNRTGPFGEFICGLGAAFVNVSATFPINKIMFRQQLYGVTTQRALKQLRKEGAFYLYRGLLPPLIQKSLSLSLMFGFYERFYLITDSLNFTKSKEFKQTIAAMGAGCCEAVLTPLERVQTLLQDKAYHNRFKNTVHAMRVMHNRFGYREFYRGLVPILLRNGPSNAVFFISREHLGEFLNFKQPTSNIRAILNDFLCGAVLGAMTGTLFYPVNVIKTRMQSKLGGEFVNVRTTFRILIEERGNSLRSIYKGVHVNAVRGLLSWGIINASYEFFIKFC
ncbi:unnamed protein product [Dimorphilus gyrociliatus]|uniref:Uncharacterized protein n=1 Tax=Dimorphilus gyrociliatus TaxID=2664684 RepID=A0A7I8VX46_9ANNE|nr:unnamed protein product [Dimorphilus gyrociliatus]